MRITDREVILSKNPAKPTRSEYLVGFFETKTHERKVTMRTLGESTHFVSGRFQGGQIDILEFCCDFDEAEEIYLKLSKNPKFSDLHIGETQSAGYGDDTGGDFRRMEKMSADLEIGEGESSGLIYDRNLTKVTRWSHCHKWPWKFGTFTESINSYPDSHIAMMGD